MMTFDITGANMFLKSILNSNQGQISPTAFQLHWKSIDNDAFRYCHSIVTFVLVAIL